MASNNTELFPGLNSTELPSSTPSILENISTSSSSTIGINLTFSGESNSSSSQPPSTTSSFILSTSTLFPILNITAEYEPDCSPPPVWTPLSTAFTLIPTISIMTLIILGNFLVILAILSQRPLRSPSNMYILSLALTDILVGLFILPFNVADLLAGGWTLGVPLCRIWLTADVTLCSSSILHISAIAVDRFRSINEGLSYAQSRSRSGALLACGGLWFLALWIASPPALGWNDWEGAGERECFLTRKWGYIVHSATGAFFIPAFVMVFLYIRIFLLLRAKFRERARLKCVEGPSTHSNSRELELEVEGERSSSGVNVKEYKMERKEDKVDKKGRLFSFLKKQSSSEYEIDQSIEASGSSGNPSHASKKTTLQRFLSRSGENEGRKHSEQISEILQKKVKFSLQKERRASKTLGILISAFLLCWTPFTLTYLMSGILPKCAVSPTFFQLVTWLGYVNSALNPVIYNMYSSEFKNAFKKLVFFWRH